MTHKIWWEREGSAMQPLPNEDIEEFANRITAIAWSNGEYVEREACAKTVEKIETYEKIEKACFKFAAKTIRARGEA